MTKQLLSISFLIGLSLAVSAQVSVNRHGQLVAGSLDTYKGMTIENGGVLNLDCDGTVYLNGGTIKAGGTLTVKAKDVKFGSDFTVEKGGILEIVTK